MNSTKPITSAEQAARFGALSFIALAAVGVIAFSARDGYGAALGMLGLEAAEDAAAERIGPDRDSRLADAQERLTQALAARPDDAMLWEALAETRFLQATGAEVRQVSQPLLSAALSAAREAVARAQRSPSAHARVAQTLSLMNGGDRRAAAVALMRSYRLAPMREALAPMRVDAAGRLWDLLDAQTRAEATVESCYARRAGASPGAPFAAIYTDVSCAPEHPGGG